MNRRASIGITPGFVLFTTLVFCLAITLTALFTFNQWRSLIAHQNLGIRIIAQHQQLNEYVQLLITRVHNVFNCIDYACFSPDCVSGCHMGTQIDHQTCIPNERPISPALPGWRTQQLPIPANHPYKAFMATHIMLRADWYCGHNSQVRILITLWIEDTDVWSDFWLQS